MAKRKDAEDWLEWAQAKYDAAQERFAWSDRSDSPTLDSYSTLISLIESENAKLRHEIFDKHMELPLDADGVPIRIGDTVWYVGGDLEIEKSEPQKVEGLVSVFAADGIYVMTRDYPDKATRPKMLTHKQPEPPDSWEKLKEDAMKGSCTYFGKIKDINTVCSKCPHGKKTGIDCWQNMNLDLVRRAKRLAGIEEQEGGERTAIADKKGER